MIQESKLQVYNRMLSTRDELKAEFIAEASQNIQKRVLIMEEFRTALRVGLYASFKNEVLTDLIFQEGDRYRKEIYYPIFDPSGIVAYFRIKKPDELLLTEGGIREPSLKQSRLRDLNTLDALIVPGVAFDLHGGRVGLGKGFYNKCLEKFQGERIALAYDFQIVSDLPQAARGRKVDWIVTEKRIVRCG